MITFKPMLAVDFGDVSNIRFPVLASPKLDGIRLTNIPGVGLRTRSLKEVPNAHVRALFDRPEFAGLDGEVICGDPTAKDVFQKTTSAVMSRDGTPDVTFHVFDDIQAPGASFVDRHRMLSARTFVRGLQRIDQVQLCSPFELDAYEADCLAAGYEGIMVRDPMAPYKFGRSTLREGYLLKVKRFVDIEAEVIGFEERMHNANEAKTNELGRTHRSSAKAGLVPMGTLGALTVKAKEFAQPFNVGTGFNDAQRAALWAKRDTLIGKIAKLKFQAVGVKEVARLPVFLGWRSPLDL